MLSPGQLFAGYRIVRSLGAGGMGEVYLAQHPRLPRQDALKLLPSELTADPTYRARFIREADLASALDHPSIVSVYDRGEDRGQLWITMKYIPGADANELMKESGPFAPSDAAEVITAVADALDYAHGKGLLHRDVKPANILIDSTQATHRKVYLTDFGIARTVGNETALTAADLTVGSIQYTSPEQLRGGDLNGRADQYSLACTAFRLLTGRAPYPERKPTEIINAHLHNPIPRARSIRADLPPSVDAVLARGMDKQAVNRYPTCMDFARDLRAALNSGAAPSRGYQPTMINPGSVGVRAQPSPPPNLAKPVPTPAQHPNAPQPTPQQPYTQPYTQQGVPSQGPTYPPSPGPSAYTPSQPYGQPQYAASQYPAAPYTPGPQYPALGGQQPNAGKRTILIVVAVFVVTLLVAGLVVWLMNRDDSSTGASPSTSTSTSESSSPTTTSTATDPAVVGGVPTTCVNGRPLGNSSTTVLRSGKIQIPAAAMPSSGWTSDAGSILPFAIDSDGVGRTIVTGWQATISVGTLPSDFTDTDAVARKMVECLAEGPGFDSVTPGSPVGTTVEEKKLEGSNVRVSVLTSSIPITGGPSGIQGDEVILAVVGSSPMTFALGMSPIGDSAERGVVRNAVLGLRAAS